MSDLMTVVRIVFLVVETTLIIDLFYWIIKLERLRYKRRKR